VQSAQQVLNMQQELQLHIGFCKEYGMEVEDIENQEEDQGECQFQLHKSQTGCFD
jgi:ATP-dependent RNA helicase DDX5/DBP2